MVEFFLTSDLSAENPAIYTLNSLIDLCWSDVASLNIEDGINVFAILCPLPGTRLEGGFRGEDQTRQGWGMDRRYGSRQYLSHGKCHGITPQALAGQRKCLTSIGP